MERSDDIADVLEVSRELSNVRQTIEQLAALLQTFYRSGFGCWHTVRTCWSCAAARSWSDDFDQPVAVRERCQRSRKAQCKFSTYLC